MKLDIEIPDITQDQVIEAMAARLLGSEYEHSGDPDDPTPVPTRWDRKAIGKHLRTYFEGKVDELARQAVRDGIDDAIRARIAEAVDAVLSEGWQQTNNYGEPSGKKLDLKARISELLTTARGDGYSGRKPALMEEHVQKAVEGFLSKELTPVIDEAKASLKRQLDAKVMKVVADTITNAVGLR